MNLLKLAMDTWSVTWRDLLRFSRSKPSLVFRLGQPVMWLVFMGSVFAGTAPLLAGAGFQGGYMQYMAPGILAMTVMFSSWSSGYVIINDRRNGYMNRMLASPLTRTAIPLGKMVALAIMSALQAAAILLFAMLLGVQVHSGILGFFAMLGIAALVSFAYSGVSMIAGVSVKSEDEYWPLINFLGMPLLMLSSAYFPVELMPSWIQPIAAFNPLTFAINPMRAIAANAAIPWEYVLANCLVLAVISLGILVIASYRFNQEITKST